jgi:hypothetical protein
MDVVFGENDDVTTGITNLEGKPDMAIIPQVKALSR